MKKLFRWHRSTLEESMKTCVEISSLAELKKIIIEEFPLTKDIKIDYYGLDKRTGWKNFIVTADGSPIGWLNGEIE